VEEALGETYTIPRTTDELYNFCVSIKNAGYTPLIYPGQLDYWSAPYKHGGAQYNAVFLNIINF
jgi:hypothetical protein